MKPVKKMLRRDKRREEISDLLDPKTAKRFARDMDNALIDTEEQVDERYAYAREIYLMQDEVTRNAIGMMIEKMLALAGEPILKFKGTAIQAPREKLLEIQMRNLTWCAVRLFVACAIWDIQIANFKLPDNKCAKCGVTI